VFPALDKRLLSWKTTNLIGTRASCQGTHAFPAIPSEHCHMCVLFLFVLVQPKLVNVTDVKIVIIHLYYKGMHDLCIYPVFFLSWGTHICLSCWGYQKQTIREIFSCDM